MKNFVLALPLVASLAACSSARVLPKLAETASAKSVRIETRRHISAEDIFVEDEADEIVYPNMMTAR